jgi:hypothetical protein
MLDNLSYINIAFSIREKVIGAYGENVWPRSEKLWHQITIDGDLSPKLFNPWADGATSAAAENRDLSVDFPPVRHSICRVK